MDYMIRLCEERDVTRVCEIYNYYVETSVITFELEPVAEAEMRRRVENVRQDFPWLVIEDEGKIAGYAYANRWQQRAAYGQTLETTIYLDSDSHGRNLGTTLYRELISRLARRESVHALVGGISLPNAKSVALHEKMGFEQVAHFREVGWKFGRWIDVGYWQRTLAPK